MMTWVLLDEQMTPDRLGFLPGFLDEGDPAPAREQFDKKYVGGWRPFHGHKMDEDLTIHYPPDPPLKPLAYTMFREEMILFYDHDLVAVVQRGGSHEICRMD
jgi:hypothetical protein